MFISNRKHPIQSTLPRHSHHSLGSSIKDFEHRTGRLIFLVIEPRDFLVEYFKVFVVIDSYHFGSMTKDAVHLEEEGKGLLRRSPLNHALFCPEQISLDIPLVLPVTLVVSTDRCNLDEPTFLQTNERNGMRTFLLIDPYHQSHFFSVQTN